MPHFTVRRNISAALFGNVPQLAKKFFYHLDGNALVDDNTVINYDATLSISKGDFENLIQNMTGQPNPTQRVNAYDYHLDKSQNLFDLNFLATLGLLPNMGNYALSAIAIAANYNNAIYNGANGNILIIYEDAKRNEIGISIHITSRGSRDYLVQLPLLITDALIKLDLSEPIFKLKPYDNFVRLGYRITKGQNEETAYKNAFEAYTVNLFNELPSMS